MCSSSCPQYNRRLLHHVWGCALHWPTHSVCAATFRLSRRLLSHLPSHDDFGFWRILLEAVGCRTFHGLWGHPVRWGISIPSRNGRLVCFPGVRRILREHLLCLASAHPKPHQSSPERANLAENVNSTLLPRAFSWLTHSSPSSKLLPCRCSLFRRTRRSYVRIRFASAQNAAGRSRNSTIGVSFYTELVKHNSWSLSTLAV